MSELTFAALKALNDATLIIASERDIDEVLQQIVDVARQLIGAQYAALGVPNEDGGLSSFIHSGIPVETALAIGHLPRGLGLLGLIIREQNPIRIGKIGDHPQSYGFPKNHPRMDSFLGVPIVAKNKTVGNLYLTNKLGSAEFSQADEDLAVMFAAHAAVAIQNAKLDEEVQRLAVLEERTRIGMDLHDGIIQSIYAVGLTLESVRLTFTQNPDEAAELLELAVEGLNGTIRDIRNFILDLRPHRYTGDLTEGIERLAREFRANTMVEISLDLDGSELGGISPTVARAIFFTCQNALANVARHARASHVSIRVIRSDRTVTMTVADDGLGFDVHTSRRSVGHGLHNMHTRAARLNGNFHVDSAPGQGTTLTITLPLV